MPASQEVEELAQEVGRRIRAFRQAMSPSTTQEQLADKAGMHRTYIGHLERGEVNVGVYNLVRLANTLGIEPADLVRGLRA